MAYRAWVVSGALAAGLLAGPAHALQVQKLQPQGAVNDVRQVVLRTDQDAVRFGDPQAPAPALVACSDPAAVAGTGHWNSAREWIWQFNRPVPAGVRCTVTLKKDFKSPANAQLKGAASYQFEVAGPRVRSISPGTYRSIDEDQIFALHLNSPVQRTSLLEFGYCRTKDVGERIPLRWIDGPEAQAIVQTQHWEAGYQAGTTVLVACNRRLTAGSTVQVVYGAGTQAPSGVTTHKTQTFEFDVRDAFTAETQCERERANAGCMPIRPLYLNFSAPITKEQASQARLVGPQATIAPKLPKDSDWVRSLEFPAPLEAATTYTLELPTTLQDEAGRSLSNASSFPLRITTGEAPALAKFASQDFGVLERFAESSDGTAVLPLTVRHMEGLDKADAPAQLRDLYLERDADIIAWWNKLDRYRWGRIDREEAAKDSAIALPPPIKPSDDDEYPPEVGKSYLSTRVVSLLNGQAGVQQVRLPAPQNGDPRPFEVVGVPLKQAGFHVLELDSPRLGASLLDERIGDKRRMYVRTSVLVTNLAVHAKLGKEGSAVWVTSLDKGQPVAGAQVQVSSCSGKIYAQGLTDSQGVLMLPDVLSSGAPRCNNNEQSEQWFVSARQDGDMAFVWSDWQNGIEPWRFDMPTSWYGSDDWIAHTVFDRNLVRAGETVSMKHFVRRETLAGLEVPPADSWPDALIITHIGSGQEYRQPLTWTPTTEGAHNAISSFAVPPQAKLGVYQVQLHMDGATGERTLDSGSFSR